MWVLAVAQLILDLGGLGLVARGAIIEWVQAIVPVFGGGRFMQVAGNRRHKTGVSLAQIRRQQQLLLLGKRLQNAPMLIRPLLLLLVR